MKHLEVCIRKENNMPTINQLVRKRRSDKTRKSKSPVLNIGYNSKEKKQCFLNGYMEMLERLQPTKIIFYGGVPDECKGSVVHITQFSEKWNEEELV